MFGSVMAFYQVEDYWKHGIKRGGLCQVCVTSCYCHYENGILQMKKFDTEFKEIFKTTYIFHKNFRFVV